MSYHHDNHRFKVCLSVYSALSICTMSENDKIKLFNQSINQCTRTVWFHSEHRYKGRYIRIIFVSSWTGSCHFDNDGCHFPMMEISSKSDHFRFSIIKVLEWRHMGVMASNHRHLDCLFNTFPLTIKWPPRFHITLFYGVNPFQCPVMWKDYPHVFIWRQILECMAFWSFFSSTLKIENASTKKWWKILRPAYRKIVSVDAFSPNLHQSICRLHINWYWPC